MENGAEEVKEAIGNIAEEVEKLVVDLSKISTSEDGRNYINIKIRKIALLAVLESHKKRRDEDEKNYVFNAFVVDK